MSSNVQVNERKMLHNKTAVVSTRNKDEETKGNSNSHLWGELGNQSTTQSHVMSTAWLPGTGGPATYLSTSELLKNEQNLVSMLALVDRLAGKPEQLK